MSFLFIEKFSVWRQTQSDLDRTHTILIACVLQGIVDFRGSSAVLH